MAEMKKKDVGVKTKKFPPQKMKKGGMPKKDGKKMPKYL